MLSHRVAGHAGAMAGSLLFACARSRRRVAQRNLELALPESSSAGVTSIARDSFRHFGAAVFESFSISRLDREAICSLVEFENWHHFAEAEELGRGTIVLTAHLGVHEMLAPVVALYRGPMHFVARALPNPRIEKKVRAIRERHGNRLLSKRHAARGMLRALENRERVAILIDQRVHPFKGVRVPFFGRPSWTSPLPAQISIRSGAPVLPVFVYRKDGGSYRVVAHPAILPAMTATGKPDAHDVERLTALYSEVTETAIRRELGQWLWMHDRWRRH